MKKKCIMLVLVMVLVMIFICCSCSIPVSYPKEGIWYCEELNMSIDFSMGASDEGVKVYGNDEQVETFACQIDYGGTVFIRNLDTYELYMKGKIKYKNDIVYIITDEVTYSFFEDDQIDATD